MTKWYSELINNERVMHMTELSMTQMLTTLFAVGGTILLIAFVVAFMMYLLSAIGIYKMGQRAGIQLSGLAFIPIANQYVIGKLLKGNFTVFGKKIESPEIVLPIITICGAAMTGIPFIGFLVAIVSLIFNISTFYHLYRKYKGDSATALTILTVIFPFIYPFMIFSMRNADPVDPSYDEGICRV